MWKHIVDNTHYIFSGVGVIKTLQTVIATYDFRLVFHCSYISILHHS